MGLWISIFRTKYLRGLDFLDSVHQPRRGSWIWNAILDSRSSLANGACYWIVANSRVRITVDPWIPSIPGFKLPPLVIVPTSLTYVRDLILPGEGGWNMDLINSFCPGDVAQQIGRIKILVQPEQDALFWVPSKTEDFSIKSAYRKNQEERFLNNSRVSRSLWKRLWLSSLHNRHKFLLWRLLSDILPTRSHLARLFPILDLECPVCESLDENSSHILLLCIITHALWMQSKWQLRLDAFHHLSHEDWIALLLDPDNVFPLEQEDKQAMLHFLAVSLEQLWLMRNRKLRGAAVPTIPDLCHTVNSLTFSYLAAARLKHQQRRSLPNSALVWIPPAGFLKINFDASFLEDLSTAGIVVRDHSGALVKAWTGYFSASTPFAAEAEAALQAFKLGEDLNFQNVIVEGDSLNVINSINGDDSCLEWQGRQTIADCRRLLDCFCFWSVYFVSRSRNSVAHNLTKWARLNHFYGYVDPQLLPPSVFCNRGGTDVSVILADPLGSDCNADG